jgi:G3E family GTPase
MLNNIQLILISGFMGAGKTTFLQNILDNYDQYKVGVLVNEFGAISVDGKVLAKDGVEIIEVNNGSIFCACLKAGFVKTMIELSKQPIDYLFIENSGLGDPSNFLKLLAEIEPYTERKFDFKGAICVVDSELFLDYNEIFTPVQNQVASSDFILVNKTDLVDQNQIEEIHQTINQINPKAFIYDTKFGQLPFNILTANLKASDFIGETSNHDWNRPANYIFSSVLTVEKEPLEEFLSAIKSKILRLKGFLKSSQGFWHVDMVGDHFVINTATLSQAEASELVIIGKDNQDFSELLAENWERLFKEKPSIIPN